MVGAGRRRGKAKIKKKKNHPGVQRIRKIEDLLKH